MEIPLDVAAARLVNMLRRDALSGACEAAYEGGLTTVLRIGPFGGKWGFSKLVRVCYLEPVRRDAILTVPLRWEATGAAGELFPVLDADLILGGQGDNQTRITLTGSYRPPLGRAGAILDKAIMNRVAIATIRSLLVTLAAAITHPPPPHRHEAETPSEWEPAAEPNKP